MSHNKLKRCVYLDAILALKTKWCLRWRWMWSPIIIFVEIIITKHQMFVQSWGDWGVQGDCFFSVWHPQMHNCCILVITFNAWPLTITSCTSSCIHIYMKECMKKRVAQPTIYVNSNAFDKRYPYTRDEQQ